MNKENLINWQDFEKIEIRVGTVIKAEEFPEAKQPAFKVTVDFGELGMLKSSAQITKLYSPEKLVGKQVIAVVNFPKKQIANMQSECLILGAVNGEEVSLLSVDKTVKNGLRVS